MSYLHPLPHHCYHFVHTQAGDRRRSPLYDVHCIPGIYSCIQSVAAAVARCVAILLLLLQLLLLAVAPCCCYSSSCVGWQNLLLVHWIWFQCYFSSFKFDLFFMYPLAVQWHLRPRFAYNTFSVITGMRGAKAGVSRPRWSPPLWWGRFLPLGKKASSYRGAYRVPLFN